MSGLWYIATPYSKYERGLEQAFQDSAWAAAKLLQRGIPVYSPIAHTHPLAIYGRIDPLDHSIWLALDQHMMDAAEGCCVICMPGWKDSYGIRHEIQYFEGAQKPVRFLSWPALLDVTPDAK